MMEGLADGRFSWSVYHKHFQTNSTVFLLVGLNPGRLFHHSLFTFILTFSAMFARWRLIIPFLNETVFFRSFCYFFGAGPSFYDPIFLRKINFNPNRLKILGRNEKSVFAEKRQGILAGKDCATLVLLCQLDSPSVQESCILFTQRAKRMKTHANEISFPGGRINGGENVEMAALREAEEEIGLDARNVALWGILRSLNLRNAEGIVTPVVASIEQNVQQMLASLKCADAEVQSIFVASVSDLLARVRYTTFRFPGQKTSEDGMPFYYRMPIFHSANPRILCNLSAFNGPQQFRIWGLTALTLLEALNSLLPDDAKEREATELLTISERTTKGNDRG